MQLLLRRLQQIFYLDGMPLTASGGGDAALIKLTGDTVQALTLVVEALHQWAYSISEAMGVCLANSAGLSQGGQGVRAAQLLAACFGSRERLAGALADKLPLVLSDSGENMQGKPVCVGHIAGDKLHATLHQSRDKVNIARQPVEPGNNKHCLVSAALSERFGQLGAVNLAPAFYLCVFSEDRAAPTGIVVGGSALGVEAQTATSLSVGRNTVVGDKAEGFG